MLEGKCLTYTRGSSPLFKNLSFFLNEGESLAIRGPNGSGKTTLLRLLTGFLPVPPKTLYWKKKSLTSPKIKDYQQNLLYVGHQLCLHPEARVKDQIQLWQDFYGISRICLEEALTLWGMDGLENEKIAHLSHGQQKRLSMTRCSWLQRPLWLLDEPQSGLDQEGRKYLSLVLAQHLKKKGSFIMATHEPLQTTKEICL